MELTEAKRELQRNGYQRKLVYKLTYMKVEEDDTWMNRSAFFDDKDEAYTMISMMNEINAKIPTYRYISLNRWSWEMFIEP